MTRGKSRRTVSKADAAAYLAKANNWLDGARESLQADRWDVAAGSAVTSGINACDAICGYLLGERSSGNHDEALGLLASAGADGQAASRQLAQLLRFKSPAQYDPEPLSRAHALKSVDLAERLVDRAQKLVR
jgi:hypothetical protein